MSWVRFDPSEAPAPTFRLLEWDGQLYTLSTRRGLAAQLVFFPHSLACPFCWQTLHHFQEQAHRFREMDCEMLVILSQPFSLPHNPFPALRFLLDPEGQVRKTYRRLLEFETGESLLLYILDRYLSPSAAWFGDEADEAALPEQALQRLEYLSHLCPE